MNVNKNLKKTRFNLIPLYNIVKSTYILILILPILFSVLCFNSTKKFSVETALAINKTLVNNSQNFVDTIFNNTFSTAIQLATDTNLLQIAYWDPSVFEENYDLNQAVSAWNSFNFNSEYIKQRYIYYPGTDNIYSGATISPAHYHYMFVYNGETVMTEDVWRDKILNKQASGLIAVPAADETRLFFTYSVYSGDSVEPLSNIVVELDFNRLVDDALGENKSRFFMFAFDGTIIDNGLKQDEISAINELCSAQEHNKAHFISSNGKEIFATKSQISNWNYGYIADNKLINKNMSFLRTITIVACLLCPLLSIIIIGKKEKVTHEIAELLPNSEDSKNKNIHQQIKNSLSKLIGENADVTSRLSSQSNILKEQILMNMLNGKKNNKFSYIEQLNLIGVDLDNATFITIAFCAINLSKIFNDDNIINDNKKQELANLIISNIMTETLAKHYYVEWVSMENLSVAIVSLSQQQSENFKSDISFILQTAFEIILSEFNFNVIAAISNPHVSLNCINNAYNESVLCMEYAFASNKSILFYNDINIQTKKIFSLEIEDDLKNSLADKDYRKCKKIIENTIYWFQREGEPSAAIARAFSYELLTIFFRNAIPNTNDTLGTFMTEVEMNSIMSESTTTSEILLKTITIVERYLNKYSTNEEIESTEKNNFYLQIKNYIDEHYANPELSVVRLSDIFKISATYLSGQFKKEFDISISDYVTSLRIETAKKLLITTNDPNSKIAQRVGYSTVRTFLRVFSKHVGITPTEYRRINNPSI